MPPHSLSCRLHSNFQIDRRLWTIYLVCTCFCYLLPLMRYYSFSFMPFLILFRDYGCELQNLQPFRPVWSCNSIFLVCFILGAALTEQKREGPLRLLGVITTHIVAVSIMKALQQEQFLHFFYRSKFNIYIFKCIVPDFGSYFIFRSAGM